MFTLTTREQDEVYTRRLEQFMDAQYKKQNLLIYMERVQDKQMQVKGIDVILDDETGVKYIDEKFAIDYRDKYLQTYSFELSSSNNWNEQGWFLNPESLTTHYLLLWFRSDEDINTIYGYDACLISKEKIYKMLLDDHVNPYEALEDFRTYFNGNMTESVGMQFHAVISTDGTVRKRMKYKDYVITQSDNKDEAPINLIIPKEKLLRYADLVISSHKEVNVDEEIAQLRDVRVALPDNVGSFVNPNAMKLLASKSIVSGNMWLVFPDGQRKQMQIKNPPHETKLVMHNKETKTDVTVAIYDKHFGEWVLVANGFNLTSIGKTKATLYKEYMKSIIRAGYIPIGFIHLDKMHNRLDNSKNFERKDGNKIISYGTHTGESKVVITYDDYTNAFVINDNTYITAKAIGQIGNTPVLSPCENSVTRLRQHFGK